MTEMDARVVLPLSGLQGAFKPMGAHAVAPGGSVAVVVADTQIKPRRILTPEQRAAVLDPIGHPEGFRDVWMAAAEDGTDAAKKENADCDLNSPGMVGKREAVLTPDGKIIFDTLSL
jgi:hypothetical protein